MCKNYKCRECGLYGHVYAECPNIRCNLCSADWAQGTGLPQHCVQHLQAKKGHKAREWRGTRTDVRCVHCGDRGAHGQQGCPGPGANPSASAGSSDAAAAGLGSSTSIPWQSSSRWQQQCRRRQCSPQCNSCRSFCQCRWWWQQQQWCCQRWHISLLLQQQLLPFQEAGLQQQHLQNAL